MRILILTKKFPYPPKDGEIIAIFNNIKAFSELGHQVTVLSINTRKHYYDVSQLPEEVNALATFHSVEVDTNVKPIPALKNLIAGGSYHIERFISVAYKKKLTELLQTHEYDVIQCETVYLSPYLDTIRKVTDTPIILRGHNVESQIWERIVENTTNPLKRLYLSIQAQRLKSYEAAQLIRYDAIVPITEQDGTHYRAMGATAPMHTCPTGVDLVKYQPDTTQIEPNSFFFIGGMDWMPNIEGVKWLLEEVWPNVIEQNQAATLYIAGRNMPNWLLNHKQEGVVVVGEVDDALEFMNSKQAMLVPLFSGSGMRIKIVEGMAMGKAIISTDIGAEGIPVSNNDNILIANDLSGFTKSLIKCMDDQAMCSHLGVTARQFIEANYDNRKFAAELLQFYSSTFRL